jgi:signal transduction histidine kinase
MTGGVSEPETVLESERRGRVDANRALKRLELLSRCSRAFEDSKLDRASRLRTVVSVLATTFDSCVSIWLLGPDGLLHLVAAQHPDAEAQKMLLTLSAGSPLKLGEGVTGQVAASGDSVLLPSIDAKVAAARGARGYGTFLERFPVHAMVGAALRVRGQVIGTVTATRYRTGETYTPEDLQLLEELADPAAQAIENSRLYQEALDDQARAEQLYRFAQAVVAADTTDGVFAAAADAIEHVLGTERSAILTLDDEGRMRFRAWRKLSDDYRRAVEGHSPWPRDVVAPEPVLVPDVESEPALTSFRPLFRSEGIGALAFIPLVSRRRLIGKFMVYYDHRHRFSSREVEAACALANLLASVIARFTATAELEETVRYNELLGGILAHDLRNPLSAMMMGAQTVLQRSEEATAIKSLNRVLVSGRRMTRMIDQLLDFTRARVAGGVPLQKENVDLRDLVTQTLDEIEIAASGWTFCVEALGDLEGEWDADRMAQVFSNLAGNAVQHGSPAEPLVFRLDGMKERTVEIEIKNRGAIAPEVVPHLFEPFRSAHLRRDGSHGLGLGLFITQQIIRAHGGEIHVTSSDADGTTFTIKLPRGAMRSRLSPSTGNASSSGRTAEVNVNEKRPVLIVDDDVDIREALAELLTDRGYSTITASNGAEALKLLRTLNEPPSMILLDIMMPVMDGYRFLDEKRLDPLLSNIPVAIITAGHGVDRDRIGEPMLIVSKPIKVPQLMAVLEQHVHRSPSTA